MKLLDIVKDILLETKKINTSDLPSQGYFYNDDFEIKIKRADIADIIEYEYNFDKNNLLVSIECIKKIVRNNSILSPEYTYRDIKSIDIIFLFLEIVKFTNKKNIRIPYKNELGEDVYADFSIENFKYFDFKPHLKFYDKESKEMLIDGYRFSLPSIGIESSLTDYLANVTGEDKIKNLNNYSYDFLFFLNKKNSLSFDEIENLIQIFNFDIDLDERKKISKIVDKFKPMVTYSLIINGNPVEIKSKLNLQDIWKY